MNVEQLHQDYLNYGQSLSKFCQRRGLSYDSVWRRFKKHKLEIIPQSRTRRLYALQESFFNIIDTEEKAYMLGFFYADACNNVEKHRVEISLAKQDEDILIKFSKILLHGNNQVKEYKSKKDHRVALYVVNKIISEDLAKWGCGSRKTFILNFPELDRRLESHFIRGYFDGDGMLTITQRLQKNCINKSQIANFSITSTKEMIDAIGIRIHALGVNFSVNKRHKKRENNNFTLRVFGNQQIKTVCDYLYGLHSIRLARKHDMYLKLVALKFRNKYRKAA